jgi:modulator of FtsH protease HflC
MNRIRMLILGLVALGLLAASLCLFQVDATEYAIVTQFGQPVRVISEPGLYAKLPDPFESVVPQTEFLTADKKNIVVEAYATWNVTDPLAFLKAVRDSGGAETRLADIVASELGAALGQVELGQLVTVETNQMKLPDMLAAATQGTNSRTEQYGFVVGDVRLKQLTFPQTNLTSVFQRMKAEREAIARQLRSEGTEQASKIRAEADTEKAKILAEANQQADQTRGKADAEAISIYAAAFQKFLRTLQSYETFVDENTTLILPSDSAMLKYLNPANITIADTPPANTAGVAPTPQPTAPATSEATP